ncbi:MAG: DNA helicase II [Nevskiaceae bacterium]|nr:MAG: DNA helicase II [Nevskiaceae bacterium]TBR72630.1 MAG: DNA helicase II [Nevskiaceae bacterium]
MIELPVPDAALTALVAKLNPAQREAVTAPPEHRLVLAGAGSGKTRVLTCRIAWLMKAENVSPWSILAVTFTNKAAAEMRGRIEKLVDVPVRMLWVGTFHGIAHRLLRMHWHEAGLPQNFQILDADDQQRLVKRVLRGLDLSDTDWPPRKVCAFINARKEEGVRAAALADQGDYALRQYARAYTAYEAACQQAGLVDFTELLLRAHELLRDNAQLLAHYQRRFRHVLVDEFQDTNALQYAWLRVLVGDTGTLFAVGDDDQSVYSWRGARVENMLHLSRDFPGTQVVRLEQNYRSTGNILNAANGLIARNSGRLGKNLWTADGAGEPIQLYAAFNEVDEAEFMATRVAAHVAEGGRHDDIAVLYRSNAQSRVLEEALLRHRLPYRIHGGLRFFERAEIKDALAYLRLVASRDDDAGFERAVNTPPRGIGATTLERLRGLARGKQVSMWKAACFGLTAPGRLLGRSANAVQAFFDCVESLDDSTRGLSLAERMDAVIESSGLRDYYRKPGDDQAEARLENLDELIGACRNFEAEGSAEEDLAPPEGAAPVDPLTEFLTHAALEAGERQGGEGQDCVQLMTLHAAKGLEFPVVFMVGMENGLFPSQRSVDDGNLEEERRLCYVGITRAKRQLYLSCAEVRRLYGSEQLAAPSLFLNEIPPQFIVEVRPRIGTRRPLATTSTAPAVRPVPRIAEPPAGGLKLGDRVEHAKFGEGTVTDFEGSGPRTRVQVRFRTTGTKWLLLALAKLAKLAKL